MRAEMLSDWQYVWVELIINDHSHMRSLIPSSKVMKKAFEVRLLLLPRLVHIPLAY